MSALGPQLTIHDAFNRLGGAHMDDTPCALILPDGTTMSVTVDMVHEETFDRSPIERDRLTVRCLVQAAYEPSDTPDLKELH